MSNTSNIMPLSEQSGTEPTENTHESTNELSSCEKETTEVDNGCRIRTDVVNGVRRTNIACLRPPNETVTSLRDSTDVRHSLRESNGLRRVPDIRHSLRGTSETANMLRSDGGMSKNANGVTKGANGVGGLPRISGDRSEGTANGLKRTEEYENGLNTIHVMEPKSDVQKGVNENSVVPVVVTAPNGNGCYIKVRYLFLYFYYRLSTLH